MKIDKKNLDYIVLTNQKALVGRVCARVEEIFDFDKEGKLIEEKDRKNLSDEQKFKLIKNSIRNYIPEVMRDIKFQLDCYNRGLEAHKIEFKKDPTDK